MSSAASVLSPGQHPASIASPDPRGSRSVDSHRSHTRPTGKGRRRRAAAEQRRLELEQWGELGILLTDDHAHRGTPQASSSSSLPHHFDPLPCDAPPSTRPPGARRQQRRASRRALAAAEAAASRTEIEEHFAFEFSHAGLPHSAAAGPWSGRSSSYPSSADQEEVELALAVSLSLSDGGSTSSARAIQRTLQGDLSFENLVNLEDVPRTLSEAMLETLVVEKLEKSEEDVVCPICLGEVVEGECAAVLPCNHTFHRTCASHWLLGYSRCCPVCKQDAGPTAGKQQQQQR